MPIPTSSSSRSVAAKSPRIFVAVAAYNDPECHKTIADLFAKAARPQRIVVGLCWQGDEEPGALARSRQVRLLHVSLAQSKGMNWARRQAQALRETEPYTLVIDSHMRFSPGWDEALLSQLAQHPQGKAIISGPLPAYRAADKLEKAKPPVEKGPRAFIATSNLFARSDVFEQVPFDPYIYFHGSQLSYSARLWTYGIDVYAPDTPLYHYYPTKKTRLPKPYRQMAEIRNLQSMERALHLLGAKNSGNKEMLRALSKYGLGKERSLADFWKFSGYDPVRSDTPEEAPEEKSGGLPRIFVRIASYRDPECQWTVKDLFEKADHPERIFVGICWQFDPYRDKACFELAPPFPEQVRTIRVHWENAHGVCWARAQTETLWRGEEYTLQIDSHMRFVSGWDEQMIAELAQCPSPKPVISCNPAHYTPPDHLQKDPKPAVRRVMPFTPQGDIRGCGEVLNRVPPHPLNAAFIAGGYVFSRSEILKEVPYDPYLYYNQEEINYAVRLYTHGWDIFSSARVLMYHYYTIETPTRPMHWDDSAAVSAMLQRRGLARNLYLLAGQNCNDPEALREIEKYGLGTVRSVAQYEEYSGVYFSRREATEKALRCLFVKDLAKYRDRPVYVPELDSARNEEQKKPPARALSHSLLYTPDRKLTPPGLQPGDFIPDFELLMQDYSKFEMQTFGGKKTILLFMPDDEALLGPFFKALDQEKARWTELEIALVVIIPAAPDRLRYIGRQFRSTHYLCSDYRFCLSRAFGFYRKEALVPHGVLLSRNLQVLALYPEFDPVTLYERVKTDAKRFFPARKPKLLTAHAPVLVVPNIVSPEFCREMIDYFNSGMRIDGLVGAGSKAVYRPSTKVRTDCFVEGRMLARLDETFSRSLFPEIRKAFNLEITHREPYKVGCYESERGGLFNSHRDNTEMSVIYRRYALSLNLNDDFEGGGLSFPEYGDDYYRPAAGSAVIFPCALMHQATKVTKGRRFMIVGFFHGAEQEALRHAISQAEGGRDTRRQYILLSARRYTGIHENRIAIGENGNNPEIHSPALFSSTLLSQYAGTHAGSITKRPWLDAPYQVLVLPDFLPRDICAAVAGYAAQQPVAASIHRAQGAAGGGQDQGSPPVAVALGRLAPELITVCIDAFCRRLAPYYGVEFEWFERPSLLRYRDHGEDKKNDAEIWDEKSKSWRRVRDRDFSLILYLNEDCEGGQLHFTHFNHSIQPRAGMLVAFPSDYRYEHTVLPVTAGVRYALVSCGAATGTERALKEAPKGAIPVAGRG